MQRRSRAVEVSVSGPSPHPDVRVVRASEPYPQDCLRCKGRGTNLTPPKGHRPGCRCVACKPCPACGGSGVAVR